MQESGRPLVSVVIPAYNAGQYIGETIGSVLNQSYQEFEIIVVDDASTDNTLQVVREIAVQDNRIKIIEFPHSGNPSVPRNKGVREAKGKYIAFLDADDIWVSSKLEEQLKLFRENNGIALVYSASLTFGDVTPFSPYYELLPLPGKESLIYNDLIYRGNTITCSSVLVTKAIIESAGYYDEDPELKVEDYDLWIRIAKIAGIAFIPAIHVYYRIHTSQFSADWELKSSRTKYLAKKRNLPLPEYRFTRNRGLMFLLLRNAIHAIGVIYYRLLPMKIKARLSMMMVKNRGEQ